MSGIVWLLVLGSAFAGESESIDQEYHRRLFELNKTYSSNLQSIRETFEKKWTEATKEKSPAAAKLKKRNDLRDQRNRDTRAEMKKLTEEKRNLIQWRKDRLEKVHEIPNTKVESPSNSKDTDAPIPPTEGAASLEDPAQK